MIGKNLMVSNNAVLDIHQEVNEDGKSLRNIKVFDVQDPFGSLEASETVDVAFRYDDEIKSCKGLVKRFSEIRCIIELKEETNNYQEIIRRAKAWQV